MTFRGCDPVAAVAGEAPSRVSRGIFATLQKIIIMVINEKAYSKNNKLSTGETHKTVELALRCAPQTTAKIDELRR